MTSPHRIGLTGGIGSGKSTVAHILADKGAAIIDADAVARLVTTPHGLAMPAIADAFGLEFISNDGSLDRDRMRAHIFATPSAKQKLESIIHPLVAQEIRNREASAIKLGHNILIFDIPLLAESARWRPQLDRILVVDCIEETQIQRVMQRNQLTRDSIQKIIDAQASRHQRLSIADWVIYNEHISITELAALVSNLPLWH